MEVATALLDGELRAQTLLRMCDLETIKALACVKSMDWVIAGADITSKYASNDEQIKLKPGAQSPGTRSTAPKINATLYFGVAFFFKKSDIKYFHDLREHERILEVSEKESGVWGDGGESGVLEDSGDMTEFTKELQEMAQGDDNPENILSGDYSDGCQHKAHAEMQEFRDEDDGDLEDNQKQTTSKFESEPTEDEQIKEEPAEESTVEKSPKSIETVDLTLGDEQDKGDRRVKDKKEKKDSNPKSRSRSHEKSKKNKKRIRSASKSLERGSVMYKNAGRNMEKSPKKAHMTYLQKTRGHGEHMKNPTPPGRTSRDNLSSWHADRNGKDTEPKNKVHLEPRSRPGRSTPREKSSRDRASHRRDQEWKYRAQERRDDRESRDKSRRDYEKEKWQGQTRQWQKYDKENWDNASWDWSSTARGSTDKWNSKYEDRARTHDDRRRSRTRRSRSRKSTRHSEREVKKRRERSDSSIPRRRQAVTPKDTHPIVKKPEEKEEEAKKDVMPTPDEIQSSLAKLNSYLSKLPRDQQKATQQVEQQVQHAIPMNISQQQMQQQPNFIPQINVQHAQPARFPNMQYYQQQQQQMMPMQNANQNQANAIVNALGFLAAAMSNKNQ